MKVKVIEQDWYTQFKQWFKLEGEPDLTPQEYYGWDLTEYHKKDWNYDGPLRYIEQCEDMPWPAREGIKYCVRLNLKPSCGYYRAYQCYCYQLGKWWKYKEVQYMFTEIHIPQYMSHYDSTKINCPYRFLNTKAQLDRTFHQREEELRQIGRSVRKSMIPILKDNN